LAYPDFSGVVEENDLDRSQGGYFNRCLKFDTNILEKYASLGGTIMLHDFENGTTNEIFRNLSYRDNYCLNVGSRIISLKWLDNSRLAFETIEGIYILDINTKQQHPLFIFSINVSPVQQLQPSILSIQLPYIIFSDHSVLRTDTAKRFEILDQEAQNGYFFTFK
jgi:hypothetical protein